MPRITSGVFLAALAFSSASSAQNIKYEAFKIADIFVQNQWENQKRVLDLMFDAAIAKLEGHPGNAKLSESGLREVLAFEQSATGIQYSRAC